MLLALLFAFLSLLGHTAASPLRRIGSLAFGVENPLGLETRFYDGRVDFTLLREDADESLAFSFQVSQPTSPVACGSSLLHLNGQPLIQEWQEHRTSAFNEESAARGINVRIPTASSIDNNVHVVLVNSSSYCYPWKRFESTEGEQAEHIFELTKVNILEVDGIHASANFTILFDQTLQQVLGVKQDAESLATLADWSNSLIEPYLNDLSTNVVQNSEHDLGLDIVSITDEIQLLKDLQWDLEVLKSTIKDQEFKIHRLSVQEWEKFEQKFAYCDGIRCRLRQIAHRIRAYIRMLFSQILSKHTDREQSQLHCVSPSLITKTKVLMTGRPICGQGTTTPTHAWKDIKNDSMQDAVGPLPEKDGKQWKEGFPPNDAGNIDPPPQYSEYQSVGPDVDEAARREFESQKKLHTILFAAASILCLGCVAVAIHRQCMSPRSRAEWRAHCEERRTVREYRQLARKRALRKWMASLTPRILRNRDEIRIQDYEEKRRLILQQEGVLENVMQDEILRLTSDEASMTEEGYAQLPLSHRQLQQMTGPSNASTRGGESLPSYRMRSHSGRPPSYTTVDQNPMDYVADGFSGYAPSNSIRHGTAASDIVTASDVTPDSSVREISPRHSSETLRTERSGL